MNINFYLERKKSDSGLRTIWCYVRENKNSIYLNTKEKINPEYWDTKTKRADIKRTANKILKGQLQGLNNFLNLYESKILDAIRTTKSTNFNAGFDEIAIEIKNAFSINPKNFFDDFEDFISSKDTYVKGSTLRKYKQTKKLLESFEKETGYKISYSNIGSLFIDKFYPYLIEKRNLIDNSVNKTISYLKVFMNWAVERKLTKNTDFRNFKIKFHQNDIIHLFENELMALYNLKLDNERLSRVRDIFCFQCFTGQRYSDIENISRIDIKNGIWKFRVSKTGQILEVPLNHFAISI
ncbi:MAG: site-specific integrase, partial [Ignavibacteriaceae bacterium]